MSTVAVICQLCGGHGPHACPGPRVIWSGTPRVLRDVTLVSWGPDFYGFTDLVEAGEGAP